MFGVLFGIVLLLLLLLLWWVYWPVKPKRYLEHDIRTQLAAVNDLNISNIPRNVDARREHMKRQVNCMEHYLRMVRPIAEGKLDWISSPNVSHAMMRKDATPQELPQPPKPPVVHVQMDDSPATEELIQEAERAVLEGEEEKEEELEEATV